jgi:methyl-accepting chemotaxis protein
MSFLGSLKFRIGTKLGLSAGLGVLLVAAMMISQQMSGSAIVAGSARVARQSNLVENVIEAKASLRGMVVAGRDIRLAQSSEALKAAANGLEERHKAAIGFVDAGLALTTRAETRERLTKIKSLIEDYWAAADQNSKLSQQRLDLQNDRSSNAVAWGKIFSAVLNSTAIANLSNRREVEAGLRDADYLFLQARNSSWRFQVTSDPAAKETASKNAEAAVAKLKETRALITDAALQAPFDSLAKELAESKNSVDRTIAIDERRLQVVRDLATPAITALDKVVEEVIGTVKKNSDVEVNDFQATMTRAGEIGLGAGLVVVLLQIGSAVFSVFNIARPIARVGAVLVELANGNKSVEIPYADRGDEVGDNARAAKTFKDNLLRIEKMEAEQKELETRAAVQRRADMHRLADDFQAAVGNIVDTVSSASTELEASASTLTKTAETTQELSTAVAAASEEASTNVNAVASASEQLAGSVNEIGRQVKDSSKIANEAVQQAQKTDARIAELSQAASRIGDVVKLITSVAEQTNLLALNATIEAARAGDAGKGFAVVAHEVKALAAQTAKATDEISAQIAGMQSATEDSVAAIKEIGITIGRMSDIAAAIAATVEEQGAATQEISRNVQQAAQGTAEVASNITNVNRGASETGSASSQVLSSARSLSSESNHLKLEVDKFLSTVRAA